MGNIGEQHNKPFIRGLRHKQLVLDEVPKGEEVHDPKCVKKNNFLDG